ncbi:MAG: sigma-54-dependent Fis family transcriptional regulator [Planctomycetaceae bacterium]|nr:sigma-54-dependent Fis family transcriptional regulator [Planctomycetaceae bacterium]
MTALIDKSTEAPTTLVRVLVVDDDEAHAQAVADSLERLGRYDCTVANSGARGAALLESDIFDVVITDLRMGDIDGLAILRKAKDELPDAEVILLTGHGSITSAVTAMQHGASTYLTKPLDIQELRAKVDQASEKLRLLREKAELNRRLDEKFGFEGVLGSSPQMHRIVTQLQQIAPTDSTVLIQGENGTGKELVARAIHQNSRRKSKPFVPLNISALSESILESELFGHEKGSFTGAERRRIGQFEYANGGTLFLDEVGEMPMNTQIKLLRVLEDGQITRVGANEPLKVNVRLVAATNADLKEMVARGTFRKDLYYRLNVVNIPLPPLRERRIDIPLLMDHFFKEMSARYGKQVTGFSKAALNALVAYDWPGNIRQLRNTVERMLVVDLDGLLDIDDLPDDIPPLHAGSAAAADAARLGMGNDALVGKSLVEIERFYIQKTLEFCEGKRDEAAALLGIGERTMYRKIKGWGLD